MSDKKPPAEKGRGSKGKNSKRRSSKRSVSPMSKDTASLSNFLPLPSGQGTLPLPNHVLDPIEQEKADGFPNLLLEEPRPGSHSTLDSHSPGMGMRSPAPEQFVGNNGYSIIQMSSDSEDVYLDQSTLMDVRGHVTQPSLHRGSENPQSEGEQVLGLDQMIREQSPEGEKGEN